MLLLRIFEALDMLSREYRELTNKVEMMIFTGNEDASSVSRILVSMGSLRYFNILLSIPEFSRVFLPRNLKVLCVRNKKTLHQYIAHASFGFFLCLDSNGFQAIDLKAREILA